MDTTTLTIPMDWLEGMPLNQEELRQAFKLGLVQLRQQQSHQNMTNKTIQALLSTGRIRHLAALLLDNEEAETDRQTPPTLPGQSVSEILIAQRRGEL